MEIDPELGYTRELSRNYHRIMGDGLGDLERFSEWIRQCPICLGREPKLDVCPSCEDQRALANLYGYSNVPQDFWRKRWATFEDCDLRAVVEAYRERMDAARGQGLGLLLTGGMGTGKTWAAAEILKEACRRGWVSWFTSFWGLKNQPDIEDRWMRSYVLTRMQRAALLVIDDVVLPVTEKQREYFTEKLEEVVRGRFHDARPTILTTNASVADLWEAYPRVMEVLARNTEVVTATGKNYGARSFQQRLGALETATAPLE